MIPLPQALSLGIRHVGIGVFDGVHLGHQEIISTVLRQTSTPQEAAILTFHPHPLEIISPERAPLRLTSLPRMEFWMQHYGIPHLVAIPFDDRLRHFSPSEFIIWLKRHLPQLQSLTVGFNWRFGYNGLGSTLTLVDLGSQLHFSTHIVPPVTVEGDTVSSTRVRETVARKDFALAEKLLGHSFEVSGTVTSGDGKGRTIGFPTANLTPTRQLLPPFGTYACTATIDNQSYRAVANYGLRPTFDKKIPQLEAHLLDFKGDLYQKEILLNQWHWLRDEKKFSDVSELKTQIAADIQAAGKVHF
jgi:riboflavin kinase/FMN adenylyltransferase